MIPYFIDKGREPVTLANFPQISLLVSGSARIGIQLFLGSELPLITPLILLGSGFLEGNSGVARPVQLVSEGRVGPALWLTPVIPELGRLKWAGHLRSGVQSQPGQHGETPSLLKIQKLAGHGGACL